MVLNIHLSYAWHAFIFEKIWLFKKKRPHLLRRIIEILIDNSVYDIVIWKIWLVITSISPGGCTSYNGLNINGEGLPERGSIFRVQVYERVGISLVEVNVRGVKKCKKKGFCDLFIF